MSNTRTSRSLSASDIKLIEVKSSQIHSIGHDPETNTLAIRFTSGYGQNRGPGSLYFYENFSAEEFEALKGAESIGKHFGGYIKNFADRYPYRKVAEQQQAA
ncbi:KTSC domain-containing protein [Stenotrophomonas sp. 278]|uniref:KTSC domain-containing protein n=1 Tax=Stenotrophomonas sp. 278 TaxID=2479851 RepID=UPI000F68522D|nr:KTSC domain-containing protein [Stenotrophomonas sp. 278]RRU23613.1 KTSC domain-containing protein [Stenotrophomonas sp. 278]